MPTSPSVPRSCLRRAGAFATLATLASPAAWGEDEPVEHRVNVVVAGAPGVVVLAGEAVAPMGVVETWAQRSVDGGVNWTPALTPALERHAIVSVVAVESGELRALTQWGQEGPGEVFLMVSTDAGASWTRRATLERPTPFAVVVGQRWTSWAQGSVTMRWEDEGGGCREGASSTEDGGSHWMAPRETTGCGAWTAPVCEARVRDAVYGFETCGEAVERQPLRMTRRQVTRELAVAPVVSSGVYGYLVEGSEVVEAATGARLRLSAPVLARIETRADGALLAHVGATGAVQDCSGQGAPTFTATLVVPPTALATVVVDPVTVPHADGSALTLRPGARVTRGEAGEWRFRFSSGPGSAPPLEVPLHEGAVSVADRWVWAGFGVEREAPWLADANERVVRRWGASTLFGQPVASGSDNPEEESWASYAPLGTWDVAWVKGTRAWVADGCAVAEIPLGDGSDVGGAPVLGAMGLGLVDTPTVQIGNEISAENGVVIGITSAWQTEPGGAGVGLGGMSGESVRVLADGRRCGALGSEWVWRADGGPWNVCWRPSR